MSRKSALINFLQKTMWKNPEIEIEHTSEEARIRYELEGAEVVMLR